MDEQPHVSGNLALPRIHWTAGVSCGFSVYTALGFFVAIGSLCSLFFPPLPLFWRQAMSPLSPLVGFLYLPGDLLVFLLMSLRPFLSLQVQVALGFLQGILYYLIPFLFACLALRISGRQAWRKGRRLAMISAILSGIVFGLEGVFLILLLLFFRPGFHNFF